jgi:hypothetical protein
MKSFNTPIQSQTYYLTTTLNKKVGWKSQIQIMDEIAMHMDDFLQKWKTK